MGSIRLFLDVLLLLLLLLCELPDLTDYFRAEKDRSQFASENNDLRAAMDHVSAEKVVTPPPPVLDAALPDCMKHTAWLIPSNIFTRNSETLYSVTSYLRETTSVQLNELINWRFNLTNRFNWFCQNKTKKNTKKWRAEKDRSTMKNQVDDMKAATDHITAEKVTPHINSN